MKSKILHAIYRNGALEARPRHPGPPQYLPYLTIKADLFYLLRKRFRRRRPRAVAAEAAASGRQLTPAGADPDQLGAVLTSSPSAAVALVQLTRPARLLRRLILARVQARRIPCKSALAAAFQQVRRPPFLYIAREGRGRRPGAAASGASFPIFTRAGPLIQAAADPPAFSLFCICIGRKPRRKISAKKFFNFS